MAAHPHHVFPIPSHLTRIGAVGKVRRPDGDPVAELKQIMRFEPIPNPAPQQLATKEIVQWTFDAIIETLVADGRIELRNFGVFEVKQRKPRASWSFTVLATLAESTEPARNRRLQMPWRSS